MVKVSKFRRLTHRSLDLDDLAVLALEMFFDLGQELLFEIRERLQGEDGEVIEVE